MSHKEYADKLVEEYQHIIESEVSVGFEYCRTAAIKCAIKQVEAMPYTDSEYASHSFYTNAITYIKSLL